MDEMIEALREANDRLANLLADPHPGLHTWCIAVAHEVESMHAITGKDQTETEPEVPW